MKYRFPILLCLCLLAVSACNGGKEFTFIHMSDPQIGFRDNSVGFFQTNKLMQQAVEKSNALKPEAVIITGDLVDDSDDFLQNAIFKKNLELIQAPAWLLPGNHDIKGYTPENRDAYVEQRGYDRFAFQLNDCAFIGIDTNPIKEDVTEAEEEQFTWLTAQLVASAGARYTFVFLHCPIIRESLKEPEDYFNFSMDRRRRYIDLFKKYGVDAVFAGHTHCQYSANVEGIRFCTAGAVGNCLGEGFPGFHVVKIGRRGFEVEYVASTE